MYAILRFDKLRSASDIRSALNHHTRDELSKAEREHIDPTKTHLNRVLVGSTSAVEAHKQIMAALPERRRKNAVLGRGFLLTASPEFFLDKTAAEIEQWAEKSMDWLRSEFGTKVVWANIQLDESTPHVQGVIIPLDNAGKLNSRKLFDRDQLRRMQSGYANAMETFGLRRGVEKSGAKHVSLKEYYCHISSVARAKIPALPKPAPPAPTGLKAWDPKAQKAHGEAVLKIANVLNKRCVVAVGELRKIEAQATEAQILRRQIEPLKAKNSALSKELEALRPLAAQVRGIDLDKVLAYHADAVRRDPRAGQVWKTFDHREVVIKREGRSWKFQALEDGHQGRNAIDLVKWLRRCDYPTAVVELAREFGQDAVVGDLVSQAREQHKQEVSQIVTERPLESSSCSWAEEAMAHRSYRDKVEERIGVIVGRVRCEDLQPPPKGRSWMTQEEGIDFYCLAVAATVEWAKKKGFEPHEIDWRHADAVTLAAGRRCGFNSLDTIREESPAGYSREESMESLGEAARAIEEEKKVRLLERIVEICEAAGQKELAGVYRSFVATRGNADACIGAQNHQPN